MSEHIAACKHAGIAPAMFGAAVEAYPRARLTLRQRALLLKSYIPPKDA